MSLICSKTDKNGLKLKQNRVMIVLLKLGEKYVKNFLKEESAYDDFPPRFSVPAREYPHSTDYSVAYACGYFGKWLDGCSERNSDLRFH